MWWKRHFTLLIGCITHHASHKKGYKNQNQKWPIRTEPFMSPEILHWPHHQPTRLQQVNKNYLERSADARILFSVPNILLGYWLFSDTNTRSLHPPWWSVDRRLCYSQRIIIGWYLRHCPCWQCCHFRHLPTHLFYQRNPTNVPFGIRHWGIKVPSPTECWAVVNVPAYEIGNEIACEDGMCPKMISFYGAFSSARFSFSSSFSH